MAYGSTCPGEAYERSTGDTYSKHDWAREQARQSKRNSRLTKREKEVLLLVYGGQRGQAVADALCVSKRTVDFHLANVFRKLGVSNRLAAYHEANRRGWLKQEAEGKL